MVAVEEVAGMPGVVTGVSTWGSPITTSPFDNGSTGSSAMRTSSRSSPAGGGGVPLGAWVEIDAEAQMRRI
jgi:hypothetical protein